MPNGITLFPQEMNQYAPKIKMFLLNPQYSMEILFSKEYTVHLSIYKKYLYTDPADRNYVIKLLRKPALHAFYQTRRGDSLPLRRGT